MRGSALLLALVAASVGCSRSAEKPTRTATIPAPTLKPSIGKFDGPSSVSCGKKGTVQTVTFAYATRNATSVEPEIDGQSPGMQAGYPPRRGQMRFSYICPGPHTLTITAFGQQGQSASKSAHVVAAAR